MIRKGTLDDTLELLDLIEKCKIEMQNQGLEQWPDFYPNQSVIESDIINQALYLFVTDAGIEGLIVLDPEVPDVYQTVDWKINSSSINSIHRLAVLPSGRSKGVGQKLVFHVENKAKKNGFTCIRLDTYSKNIRAGKFYQKLGYQKRGEIHLSFMPETYFCFEKAL